MKLRWSHAVLYVRDINVMIDFYRDVLGFQVSDRGLLDPKNPDLEMAFLSQVGTDHHQLAFVPLRGEDGASPLDHMAFRVESFADVKALVEKLQTDSRVSGINLLSHGNAWSVYFKDPEGNGVEVFSDSPFHVRQPQGKPWNLSMTEEDMRRATIEQFGNEPEFKPIEEFYAEHRRKHGE